MIKLYEHGAYLLNGTEIIEDVNDAQAAVAAKTGQQVTKRRSCKKHNCVQHFRSTQYFFRYGEIKD